MSEALKRLQEEYISEPELAKFFGITVASLRNRASRGMAPPAVPGTWKPKLYSLDALKTWLKKNEKKAG